ncbi:MAG TPA: TonB-dependent receptor plug domain-containing protein, partial [Cyclobacteriaceae bacterium]|nr:TonB-dependent receptor plug domain-containing protein [Cyclobacteriaceae bacterium]
MIKYGILTLTLFLPGLHTILAQPRGQVSVTLSGNIIDKDFGGPIPGAYVYIPDLKTGSVSDDHGDYQIKNLPPTRVLVQVSFIGYKDIITSIDLSAVSQKDFVMEQAAIEMNEVIITGSSKSQELNNTPTPITIVPRLSLLQGSSTNIIDAIATLPGLSQVTTGPGISKPVIRGLGYNRIVVVHDGVRQEGQQWGDEHGIEIDEASVNKVEILKGPASLAYGSDALAGVINMISSPTLPEGSIAGNLGFNYQSNNGLLGYSAGLGGNSGGFVWDAKYGGKIAHAYRNRYDGFVYNSGYRENAARILLGLNKHWGYSHLTLGLYELTPGIIEGERDSLTGKFIKTENPGDPFSWKTLADETDFLSYRPSVPFQKVGHYKAVLNSNLIIGQGNLKTIFCFQQNRRQEFADAASPDEYDQFFLMNSMHYDVQYNFPQKNFLDAAIGLNGMKQSSVNLGTEFLIPEYNLFDIGVF